MKSHLYLGYALDLERTFSYKLVVMLVILESLTLVYMHDQSYLLGQILNVLVSFFTLIENDKHKKQVHSGLLQHAFTNQSNPISGKIYFTYNDYIYIYI